MKTTDELRATETPAPEGRKATAEERAKAVESGAAGGHGRIGRMRERGAPGFGRDDAAVSGCRAGPKVWAATPVIERALYPARGPDPCRGRL